ncbi:hypothetical protein [Zymobacter sp. IVIA_5232.4 C2]|uniref:hypothetical protein n=1 Tax=Zymobacter sp. IVIA_5232.4 C2 TaxID=3394855 RepID=UPI0039C404B0
MKTMAFTLKKLKEATFSRKSLSKTALSDKGHPSNTCHKEQDKAGLKQGEERPPYRCHQNVIQRS